MSRYYITMAEISCKDNYMKGEDPSTYCRSHIGSEVTRDLDGAIRKFADRFGGPDGQFDVNGDVDGDRVIISHLMKWSDDLGWDTPTPAEIRAWKGEMLELWSVTYEMTVYELKGVNESTLSDAVARLAGKAKA